MGIPNGLVDYERSYVRSPIILVGGNAAAIPGAIMPMVGEVMADGSPAVATFGANVEGENEGAVVGPAALDISGLNASFYPLPGSTVVDNDVGMYPFANQSIAANAIITKPLTISLLMVCPTTGQATNARRLAAFTNLVAQLAKHQESGGLFNIATPSMLYTNCILVRLADASESGEGPIKAQNAWRWDFVKPLVSLADAQGAQNLLMRKLDQGLPVSGDPPAYSGASVGVGSAATLQGPSAVPAAQPLQGAAASGRSG